MSMDYWINIIGISPNFVALVQSTKEKNLSNIRQEVQSAKEITLSTLSL